MANKKFKIDSLSGVNKICKQKINSINKQQ